MCYSYEANFLVCHNLTVSVNSFTIVKSVLGQSLRQQKTRPLKHKSME